MLHGLVGFCFDVLLCRFKIGAHRPGEVEMTVFIKYSLLRFHEKFESNCVESVVGRAAARSDESQQPPRGPGR